MFRIIAYRCRCEKSKVPILGDVPVEGIEGVEENEEKPIFELVRNLSHRTDRITINGRDLSHSCRCHWDLCLAAEHSVR